MVLPATFNTRPVHFAAIALDGTPMSGTAVFTTLTTLTMPDIHTRIPPKPITLAIENGELNGSVPLTGDPEVQPRFVYEVSIRYDGGYPGETFFLEVPPGTEPLELANFAALGAAPAPLVSQVLSIAELTGHVTLEQLQALGLGNGTGGGGGGGVDPTDPNKLLPLGGTIGQYAGKNSSTDGDLSWRSIAFSEITGNVPLHASSRITDFTTAVNALADARLAALTAGAPALMNTLDELSAALGDDPNFATTITALLGTKVTKPEQLGYRFRTGADQTGAWEARPSGFRSVVSIGIDPSPTDQAPFDIRWKKVV